MELKLEQQFKKGALEMVLLSLIARQRSYGYVDFASSAGGRRAFPGD